MEATFFLCFISLEKQNLKKRLPLLTASDVLSSKRILLLNFDNGLAAHVRSQCLRDPDGAVFVKVVLKESDEHSRRSNACIVKSMSKVSALRSPDPDLKTSCLSVAQVGAGTYFEILLLSGRPCLNVTGLDLEVSQIAGAALECSYGDVE